MTYTAIYTQEPEGGYTVEILELPGCVSFGESMEDAEKMIKEAIYLYKESQEAHKEHPIVGKKFISSLQLN